MGVPGGVYCNPGTFAPPLDKHPDHLVHSSYVGVRWAEVPSPAEASLVSSKEFG